MKDDAANIYADILFHNNVREVKGLLLM
jgi:hypothetical protein